MQKDIEQSIKKLGKYTTTISFTYEYAYTWCVSCTIERHNKICIWSVSDTQEKALDRALKLLEKLTSIELNTEVVVPELKVQPWNKGYHHVMVNETQKFSYKRLNNKFYLTSIHTLTDDGFLVLDVPVPIDKTYKLIEVTPNGDLYEWNDLGVLSGSAGLAYVKGGLVIAAKTTHIS